MSAPYVYTPTERASRRLGLMLLILIGVALTTALFAVKTRAQSAKADVVRLTAEIEAQRTAIAVLTAEHAVLSNPSRLRALSQARLGLTPVTTDMTGTLDDLAVQP